MTTLQLTPDILAAIGRIVDYLADDEFRDFETQTPPDDNHVYRSIRFLQNWLAQARNKPIHKPDSSR